MDRRDAIKQTALIMGYTFSATTLSSIMAGCEAGAKPFIPSFLSPEQFKTISAIAETILPKSDTPGAIDVKVPEFIDGFLDQVMPLEGREKFMAGLNQFMQTTQTDMGKSFDNASAEEQASYLVQLEDSTEKEILDFYRGMRSMTIRGYFTSEEIGTKFLKYDPVPGMWQGCTDLEETTGGIAWTL